MKRIIGFLCALLLLSASALAQENVLLPEGYTQGEPLPVYRAVERTQQQLPIFDCYEPEWLNASGVATRENQSKRARYDHVVFQDGAELSVDTSVLIYEEKDGAYLFFYGDDPDSPEGPIPMESYAAGIGRLVDEALFYQVPSKDPFSAESSSAAELSRMAQEALFGRQVEKGAGIPALVPKRTELAGITLSQAQAQVQAVLGKLGLTDYAPSLSLDLSVDRIHALGEWRERFLLFEGRDVQGKKNHRDREHDFTQATEADEGFYLRFERRIDGVRLQMNGSFYAVAFVNAQGIARLIVRDFCGAGDVHERPDRLLTSEEALECLERDRPGHSPVIQMELCYTPARASQKKDGLVLMPAWYIVYDMGTEDGLTSWACYSAIDGSLLEDDGHA